jgi:hypothetical protein
VVLCVVVLPWGDRAARGQLQHRSLRTEPTDSNTAKCSHATGFAGLINGVSIIRKMLLCAMQIGLSPSDLPCSAKRARLVRPITRQQRLSFTARRSFAYMKLFARSPFELAFFNSPLEIFDDTSHSRNPASPSNLSPLLLLYQRSSLLKITLCSIFLLSKQSPPPHFSFLQAPSLPPL